MFAEFPPRLGAAEIQEIAGEYLHHAGRPDDPRAKIAVFSRLPVGAVEPIGIDWRPNHQGLALVVATPSGPLGLVGVHPSVPALPIMQRARDETANIAFARLRAFTQPAVLVGDFNTVSWSPLLRDASQDSALRRARIGAGSTWMSPFPVLGLPIDHAFAAGRRTHLGTRWPWHRVGPSASDHRCKCRGARPDTAGGSAKQLTISRSIGCIIGQCAGRGSPFC